MSLIQLESLADEKSIPLPDLTEMLCDKEIDVLVRVPDHLLIVGCASPREGYVLEFESSKYASYVKVPQQHLREAVWGEAISLDRSEAAYIREHGGTINRVPPQLTLGTPADPNGGVLGRPRLQPTAGRLPREDRLPFFVIIDRKLTELDKLRATNIPSVSIKLEKKDLKVIWEDVKNLEHGINKYYYSIADNLCSEWERGCENLIPTKLRAMVAAAQKHYQLSELGEALNERHQAIKKDLQDGVFTPENPSAIFKDAPAQQAATLIGNRFATEGGEEAEAGQEEKTSTPVYKRPALDYGEIEDSGIQIILQHWYDYWSTADLWDEEDQRRRRSEISSIATEAAPRLQELTGSDRIRKHISPILKETVSRNEILYNQ